MANETFDKPNNRGRWWVLAGVAAWLIIIPLPVVGGMLWDSLPASGLRDGSMATLGILGTALFIGGLGCFFESAEAHK